MTRKIHHSTQKRADKEKITLEENGIGYSAVHNKKLAPIWSRDPKNALEAALLDRTLRSEYPALSLTSDTNEEPEVWRVSYNGEIVIETTGEVPGLSDALDAAMEVGYDEDELETSADAEETEKPETSGKMIVPAKYRQIYAERGNSDHCGDWLAQQLEGEFETGDGFNHTEFEKMLVANSVELKGKWAELPTSGQRGWQGRYRMNGRQKLEICVMRSGVLVLAKRTETVPQSFLDAMLKKHPEG